MRLRGNQHQARREVKEGKLKRDKIRDDRLREGKEERRKGD